MPSVTLDNILISFLRTCKEKLHNQSGCSQYLLVSGNEACDLDSSVCSLAYAFFKQKKLGSSTVVLPVFNIRKEDMRLRGNVTYWLEQCGLPWEECIFIDDLFPSEASATRYNFTGLVLVDHFAPSGYLAEFTRGLAILEVIDHHNLSPEDQLTLAAVSGCKRIEPVGSCASLVTMELLFDQAFAELPPTVWKLLYGAILTDTLGLSDIGWKSGRLTELDLRAADRIEDLICNDLFAAGLTRQDIFSALEKAKFNVSGLSTRDLLRRDLKMTTASASSTLSFLCCTISGLDFQPLLRRPDFSTASAQLCREHSAQLLIGITQGCTSQLPDASDPALSGQGRKGFFVFSPQLNQDALCQELVAFLTHASCRLMLASEPMQPDPLPVDGIRYTGVIGNLKATRKMVLPLLVQFQRHWLNRQSGSNNNSLVAGSTKPAQGDGGGGRLGGASPRPTNSCNSDDSDSGKRAGGSGRSPTYDQVVSPLAPLLADVGDCLADWLSPLTMAQRSDLLKASRGAQSAAATTNGLISLYQEARGSVAQPVNKLPAGDVSQPNSETVNRLAQVKPALLLLTTPPTSVRPTGIARQVAKPEKQLAPRWSMQQQQNTPRGISGLSRRQTVPACVPVWPEEQAAGRFECPRKHSATSQENVSSLSDGEMVKPGWLETEYLSINGCWLRDKLACASLDAVEGVSFSLYRRLSAHPDQAGTTGTALPTDQALEANLSSHSLTGLEPAEMALWRTSMRLAQPVSNSSESSSIGSALQQAHTPPPSQLTGGRGGQEVGQPAVDTAQTDVDDQER